MPVPPPKDVDLQLGFKALARGSGGLYRYRLDLEVTNIGSERITDYWIELEFPKQALDGDSASWIGLKFRETATHVFLRQTRTDLGVDLYPGDSVAAMDIEYHVGGDIGWDPAVLKEVVIARVGVSGMETRTIEKPFRELQEF